MKNQKVKKNTKSSTKTEVKAEVKTTKQVIDQVKDDGGIEGMTKGGIAHRFNSDKAIKEFMKENPHLQDHFITPNGTVWALNSATRHQVIIGWTK